MKKEKILEILRTVNYPGLTRDIVSFGLVKDIDVSPNGDVSIKISVTTSKPDVPAQIENAVKSALAGTDCAGAQVVMSVEAPKAPGAQSPTANAVRIPGVKRIIAVASGKGGVGKSTVSVNLAAAIAQVLQEEGIAPAEGSVGLFDCDIYGPSVPMMLGVKDAPQLAGEKMRPREGHGLKVMSMGLFLDEDTPVVWRGPMLQKAIKQFTNDVDWGALEALVVDLPPGTGDAQITLVQTLELDGAIVVTTPQQVAASIARRGAHLFDRVGVPLLGVVENMSYLEPPKSMPDGERQYIFGNGGGSKTALALGTEFLGEIALSQEIREGGDEGTPIVISLPDSVPAQVFRSIARIILKKLP